MRRRGFLLALGALALARPAAGAERVLTLGSTTTTENSGLLGWLAPRFEAASGITLRVVVAGSGKILRLAENGDLDVTLTHDPAGEADFIARGLAPERRILMRNDFLIVGPADDPADVAAAPSAADALSRIAAAGAAFLSRGDDSGTHRKELTLWPGGAYRGAGYRETGLGMGATLNIAAATGAYALTDRATWASFGNRGDLAPLHEGDPVYDNLYAAMIPAASTRPVEARVFVDWLAGREGQAAIAAFRIGDDQVFFPAATEISG